MIVRPITAADWPVWWALRQRAMTEDGRHFSARARQKTEAATREWLDTSTLFLGEVDGVAAGIVGVLEDELISMWVAAEARRSGLGRSLVETALAHGATTLQVMDGNERALRLYRSCGFELVDDGPDAEGKRAMALR